METLEKIPECKVTLIGDSGVGKSSIIGRYISGIFMDDCITSSGANYSQKTFEKEGKKLRLNIWDTAGQERYRGLGRTFYKDAFIICLVYDITEKNSFNNIKQVWYPEIKKFGEKYIILSIVGNKSDLYEIEEVNDNEAKNYANEIGADYFLVSAKNGNGIENMFNNFVDKFLSPDFKDKIYDALLNRSSSVKLAKKHITKKKCC
jgi:small GTP-binding protein